MAASLVRGVFRGTSCLVYSKLPRSNLRTLSTKDSSGSPQSPAVPDDSGIAPDAGERALAGFAKALEKAEEAQKQAHETAVDDGTTDTETEHTTFAAMLRHSKLMQLGDISGRMVLGTVTEVVEDDLYIDVGGKFHCVCPRPKLNPDRYHRGVKVKVRLNDLEMSSSFLGSQKHVTLLEADGTLIGLRRQPTSCDPAITRGVLEEYHKVYRGVLDFRDTVQKILSETGMISSSDSLSAVASGETHSLDHTDSDTLTDIQQLTAVILTTLATVTDTISNIFSGNIELLSSVRQSLTQSDLVGPIEPKTESLDPECQDLLADITSLTPDGAFTQVVQNSKHVRRKSLKNCAKKSAVDSMEDVCDGSDVEGVEGDSSQAWFEEDDGKRKAAKGKLQIVSRVGKKPSASEGSISRKRRKKKAGLQKKAQLQQRNNIKCEFCLEKFQGRRDLGNHLRRAHPEQTRKQCAECDKVTTSLSALRNHMRSHSDKKAYKCSQCEYASRTYRELKTHTARVHKAVKDHLCAWCGKAFAVACALTAHVRLVHHKEKPHHCEECGARFLYPSRLAEHRNTVHSKELQFACEFCGSRFFYEYQLKKHKQRHHSAIPVKRPYQCEECGKGFFSPSELKVHRRVHTKERPFRCGTCGAGFAGSNGYHRHMRIHLGIKAYQCQVCQKTYRDSWTLKNHMQSVHSGQKPFQCHLCQVRFSHRNSFTSHMKRHAAQQSEAPAGEKSAILPNSIMSENLASSVLPMALP